MINEKLLYSVSNSKPAANFIFAADPTVSENPQYAPCSWINTTTGHIWVCIDNTPDANVWVDNG